MPRKNYYDYAVSIDKNNGNYTWADCVKFEKDQQYQHDVCKDMDKVKDPKDHKKIRVHFVFDVKHYGRHKARLVAYWHLTDVPL